MYDYNRRFVKFLDMTLMCICHLNMMTWLPFSYNAVFIAAIAAIVLAITTGLGVGGISVIVGTVFMFFSMNGIIAATSSTCALDAVLNTKLQRLEENLGLPTSFFHRMTHVR